ncbi:ornithine cyclodeaminase family protein [Actinophytocola sp.]|uniref:ornithine cyclodeaminase family protein n=1 Tax=Actinophytocola sp. TaxID=1872138 RepID=UPI002D5B9A2C|nr:ornithine cyclodeaminase family protein [Actinophytocola sp.]HYQ70183.1 ornithine cyclodeaminase family protein [Actinophytocola sp.]
MIPLPDARTAVEALRTALRDGLDPEADWARSRVPMKHGELRLMPAEWGRYAGMKVVSVAPDNPARGLPRVQGTYLLLDAETLGPLAVLDGAELTTLRTAAVSALAVDALAVADAARLVVFGTGPQARSHITAVRAVRPLTEVTVVGRTPDRALAFVSTVDDVRVGAPSDVARADVVVCATTSREPLFDGGLLPSRVTVVAVGSHEHSAAEVDFATVCGSTVVVEARSAALREAGDITQPVAAGAFDPSTLVELVGLVRGSVRVDPDRPRLFKSVGMGWEDLVIAASGWERRS